MEAITELREAFARDPGSHGIDLGWALAGWLGGPRASRARAVSVQAEAIAALRSAAIHNTAAAHVARQDQVFFLTNFAHMIATAPDASPGALADALAATDEAVDIQRGILAALLQADLPVHPGAVSEAYELLSDALRCVAITRLATGLVSSARTALDEATECTRLGPAAVADEGFHEIAALRRQANPLRVVPPDAIEGH